MSYLSKLVVLLQANIAEFQSDMGKAAQIAAKSMQNISRSVDGAANLVKTLGSAFVVTQIAGFAKDIIDSADKLQDLSNRTGIATKNLAALDYVASQTGASTEALAKGMRTLDTSITEMASGGAKDMKRLFSQLGLDDLTSGAVTGTDALLRLAEVFPRLNDAQRQFVSAKLGKSFHELIPALAGGRAEMEKMIKTGQDLSGDITELAKNANEFNDNVDKLSRALKSSLVPALNALLPVMTQFSEGMIEMQKSGSSFLASIGHGLLAVGKDAGKSVQEYSGNLVFLKKQLADFQAMPEWKQTFSADDIKILKTQIDLNEKQLVLAKSMQRTQALAGAEGVYSNEGRMGSSGPIKLDVADGKTAKAAKSISEFAKQTSEADKLIRELRTDLDQVGMDDFEKKTAKVNSEIDKFVELGKTKQDQLKEEALLIRKATDAREMAYEMEKGWETDRLDDIAEVKKSQEERIQAFVDQTPTAQLEKERATMVMLAEAYESGRLTVEQYLETVEVVLNRTQEVTEEVSSFWQEAAKNIQNAMGDWLVSAMEGNWKDIGDGFTKMLNRMVAEALAAQLMQKLVGSGGGKGGNIGGWIGMAMDLWSGSSGGASTGGANAAGGMRAGGGSVSPGMGYMIGESGPEWFTPAVAGNISPTGGGRTQNVYQSFTISQPASRETQQQLAAAAQSGLNRAARRNN